MQAKRILIVICLLCCISSCVNYTIETSEEKTETATVVQMVYIPSTQRVDIAPAITFDGDFTFAVVSTGSPEFHGVTFRCDEHQKTFTLTGKSLYEKLKPGDKVELTYVELTTIYPDGRRETKHVKTIGGKIKKS